MKRLFIAIIGLLAVSVLAQGPGRPRVSPTHTELDKRRSESFTRYVDQNFDKVAPAQLEPVLKRCLEWDPTNVKAGALLAALYCKEGKVQKGREFALEMLQTYPKSCDLYSSLGYIESIDKKWQAAAPYLVKAVALGKNDAQTRYNLALAYINLGKKDKSLEQLKLAAKLDKPYIADAVTYPQWKPMEGYKPFKSFVATLGVKPRTAKAATAVASSGTPMMICPRCGGRRMETCSYCYGNPSRTCTVCGGSGKQYGGTCFTCSGTGTSRCTHCNGGQQDCSVCHAVGQIPK